MSPSPTVHVSNKLIRAKFIQLLKCHYYNIETRYSSAINLHMWVHTTEAHINFKICQAGSQVVIETYDK